MSDGPQRAGPGSLDAAFAAEDLSQLMMERPDLSPLVIRALYRRLSERSSGIPDLREAREYVDLITSEMDETELRMVLGPHPIARKGEGREHTGADPDAAGRSTVDPASGDEDQASGPAARAKKGSAPGPRHAPQHGHRRVPSSRSSLPAGWTAREARTMEREVTVTDRVLLRYGDDPAGSLTFDDGDGIRRTVRGGEEFETDPATAQVLVKGDPLNVVAVPRIELDLRRERPDLAPERIRDLVTEACMHLESLGDMATPQAIRAEVERSAPPAAGLPTTKTGRRIGRPKGTRAVPRDRLIERYRSLRKNSGRAPTQDELARSLDPPIKVRTLQDHLTAYDLAWPIE